MSEESKTRSYTFKKVVKGKIYTCTKSYTVTQDKPGRPKMTEDQKIQAKIARLQKKLYNDQIKLEELQALSNLRTQSAQ